ncbi:MAG: class II fructose-bisphosphatase [Bdellovibrionales bacterium]|nr:class II fructose-bisphosphatase [Bdellovibrionales bacterium]
MDRNLALEFVRITEAAAIASARFMGRGDGNIADQAAVDAMRKAFDRVDMDGTVVIGEGERDEAPMLYIGEKVGQNTSNAPKIDIALDPLEGTNLCANGGIGATSVIAVAENNCFLHAPDTYMNKIAVGPKAKGAIDITKSPTENLNNISEALKKSVNEITVCILDRPRHNELIQEVRKAGARIQLISDGDVSGAISTGWDDSGIDVLMGIGGAPEGVISAAAMKCMGGDFQGILKWRHEEEKTRAKKMGIEDLDRVYRLEDLAKGPVMFIATGVTTGPLLKGVRFLSEGKAMTHSIVMRSATQTIRTIEATHYLQQKTWM